MCKIILLYFYILKKLIVNVEEKETGDQLRAGCDICIILCKYLLLYNSHVINGVTIVHSHFHGKTHKQTGTHSESELTLMSVLSFFHSLQANVCFVALEVFLLQAIIPPLFTDRIIPKSVACITLRAPPTLL